MGTIRLCPVGPSELDAIYALQKEQIDSFEYLHGRVSYEQVLRQIKKHTLSRLHQYKRIEIDGAVAGFYLLYCREEGLELEDFYLFPAYRGKGIGSIVLQKIQDENRNKTIFLYVFSENRRAVHFYQQMGFRICGQRRTRLRMAWEGGER